MRRASAVRPGPRAPCEHFIDVDADCGRAQHARLQADVDAVVAQARRGSLEDGQPSRIGLRHLHEIRVNPKPL